MEIKYRSTVGVADHRKFLEVHAERLEKDGVDSLSPFEDIPDPEQLRAALREAEQTSTQDNWRVAEVGDGVVGYSRVNWWHEDDGKWVYLIRGWVKPRWRGLGIGSTLLAWGETHARWFANRDHPGDV